MTFVKYNDNPKLIIRKKGILFFLLLLGHYGLIRAQSGLERSQYFVISDSIVYYGQSTNPVFFRISTPDHSIVPDSLYRADFAQSKVFFDRKIKKFSPKTDSIRIEYRIYPEYITRIYRERDTTEIFPESLMGKPKPAYRTVEKESLFGDLNTSGKITRGLSIGTDRDALLNSVMDLRIEGKLNNKISLNAHINDTNIPLQENGYSQDLKDLDRVYIQMKSPHWTLTAGDIMMQNRQTAFVNFQKKISGISLDVHLDDLDVSGSAAKVKGRYTEYRFNPQEGNQGPYKLKGQTGENYIFIISGSEKVYVNGILKKRGIDNDYTIDYNTAEITFTPSFPVTADMRITVQYQYSERNYTRFITFDQLQYHTDQWKTALYVYSEQDKKTDLNGTALTGEQIAQLAAAGSNRQTVYIEHIVETPYTDELILYRKTPEGYFEYSTDPDETLYSVGFSYFGENQGDYIISSYQANGRIMQYVGENQGDYRAVIPVTPPSRNTMIVWQNQWKPGKKTDFNAELAYADNDYNLFAPGNDNGRAPAFRLRWRQILTDTTRHAWLWETALQSDYRHQNFKAPERTDPIEFQRQWNLDSITGSRWLNTMEFRWRKQTKKDILYRFEHLNYKGFYSGYRQSLIADMDFKYWHINQQTAYLSSGDLKRKGHLLTNRSQWIYRREKGYGEVQFSAEENRLTNRLSQLPDSLSYRFSELLTAWTAGDTTSTYLQAGIGIRHTDSIRNNRLTQVRKAYTFSLKNKLLENDRGRLEWQARYRHLYIVDSLAPAFDAGLAYSQKLWHGLISWRTSYNNYSGNIARQEYTYIHTEPGQGYYTWTDYNGNGIPENDEFEVAVFSDQADYLRVALPNTHYIRTRKADWNQRVAINFSALQKFSAWKWITPLSADMSIKASDSREQKLMPTHWNPLTNHTRGLVAKQYFLSCSTGWNRGKNKYSAGYRYTETRQNGIDVFGSQKMNNFEHQVHFRHALTDNLRAELTARQTNSNRRHESFTSRNYSLNGYGFAPSLVYQWSKEQELTCAYRQEYQRNRIGDRESNRCNSLEVNYKREHRKKGLWSIQLKWLQNRFTGNADSPTAYVMLEGLQKGDNVLWNIHRTARISSLLGLELSYDGRYSTQSGKAIHNGSVMLKATF